MPGSRRRKRKIRDRSPIKIKLLKTSPRRAKFVKQEPKSEDEFEEEADAEEVEEQAQTSKRKGYRQNYSLKDLLNAYNMVKYENMPVQTAAKTFGVPSTTLRDRVRGNVVLESVRPGPSSLLSIEQEMTLVDHISFMASIGCGYTRNDIFNLATDLAVHLGLIKEGRQLQRSWYRRFRSRWPVINAVRPNRSARKRSPAAVALEQESIKKYFEELHDVLEEHDLMEKPHRIFTLDESFIPQTRDKTDPECCVKAIGCGNAIGSALPPYFVFPQSSDSDSEKTEEKIVSSANPGALIRFRETYDDWSESEIFQDYIRSHFLQSAEVGEASPEDPVLILYDRAKHHVSSCIEWAKGLNIVLYLLPPFYGYATCSEQIGCLGQMKRCAMQECEKFLFFNSGKKVSKGSLCNFVSNAYEKVMSAESLIALFRKTGTYPYNPDGIAKDRLPAYIIMPNKNKVEKTSDTLTAAFIRQTKNQARKVAKKSKSSRTEPYKSKSKRRKKVRKRESSDSGSDLDDFEQEFESKMAADSDKEPLSPVQPPSIPILTKTEVVAEAQPESSTEETQTEIVMEEIAPEPLDGEEEESEGEYTCITDGQLFTLKCAICKKYNPPKTFLVEGEAMISWTQCDSCQAWAHLCCSTVSIPVPDCPFLCPPCTIEFKLFGNSYTPSNITEWINAKRAITENILSAQNN